MSITTIVCDVSLIFSTAVTPSPLSLAGHRPGRRSRPRPSRSCFARKDHMSTTITSPGLQREGDAVVFRDHNGEQTLVISFSAAHSRVVLERPDVTQSFSLGTMHVALAAAHADGSTHRNTDGGMALSDRQLTLWAAGSPMNTFPLCGSDVELLSTWLRDRIVASYL